MRLNKRLYYLAHGSNPEQLMDRVNLLWDNGNNGELVGSAFALQTIEGPKYIQQMILEAMPNEHVPCSKENALAHIVECLNTVQKKYPEYFKERVHYSNFAAYVHVREDRESIDSPGPVIYHFVKELCNVFHNVPDDLTLRLDVCDVEHVYGVLLERFKELLVKSPVYQEVKDAIGMNL